MQIIIMTLLLVLQPTIAQEDNVFTRYGEEFNLSSKLLSCDGQSRNNHFDNATIKAECDKIMLEVSEGCAIGYTSLVCDALRGSDIVGNYIVRENLN